MIDGEWTLRFDFDAKDPEFNLATYGFQGRANQVVSIRGKEDEEIEISLKPLPPVLAVLPANNRVRMSWPWKAVPGNPTETFTEFTLDVDKSGSTGSYRLRAP